MNSDTSQPKPRVSVTRDGPYAVSGGPSLSTWTIGTDAKGQSVEWRPGKPISAPTPYFLCRCGGSASKPFCDGSHKKIGFDGQETASRAPYATEANEIDGPTLALTDAEKLCAFARFCDRDGQVWNTVLEVQSPAARAAFTHQVAQCPSGRLVAWEGSTGKPLEPKLQPSIVLIEDPAKAVSGPIWVRGGIDIIASDGSVYELRNRVTLCRCGRSSNKPFCDGTHASIGFTDAQSTEKIGQ